MFLLPEVDPMGQAIHDFYFKKNPGRLEVNSTITEDEDIEVAYLFRAFREMPEIEQKAMSLCRGAVLDVGAAAGAHTLYLQNQGINVEAIDISQLSVDVMKHRGVNQVLCADFFDLNNKTYDTLLFLMNGIGLCGSLKGLGVLLQQCKKLLNTGGQVLLDSSDIKYMFEGEEFEIEFENCYYGELEYQMNYKETEGEVFDWLFIDFNTLQQVAKANGFNCEKIIDGPHYDYLARLTL